MVGPAACVGVRLWVGTGLHGTDRPRREARPGQPRALRVRGASNVMFCHVKPLTRYM